MSEGQRRGARHRARLTVRSIAEAPARAQRYVLWDTELAGFGALSAAEGRGGGPAVANHFVSLLGAVYRFADADHEGLRDPVALWRAGGGRRHRVRRRTIAPPAEVLPCWRAGLEAVPVAVLRDMV